MRKNASFPHSLACRVFCHHDRRLKTCTLLLFAFFFLLGGQPGVEARKENSPGELAQAARTILETRCFRCHGRNGKANKDVFVLDRNRLVSSRTVVPGKAASLLLQVVENETMPLGADPLPTTERATLRDWILAGAPDWDSAPTSAARVFVSESAILNRIALDLDQTPERSRPFYRYFSLVHLANAGVPADEIKSGRVGLTKLLNSLSFQRDLAVPQPLDDAGLILRIDLRDLNWTSSQWDSILGEYPYGVRTPLGDSIGRTTGVAVPYVRADWFAATASRPPLYHTLLGLPQTLRELERTLGIEVDRNLAEERNVVRAGIRNSGVSQNQRVVERHSSPYGAYWRSYDFKTNLGNQNVFQDPLRIRPDGGEVIFNLPNGLQAYYIADAAGRRIDAAPVDIVADRTHPEDPVVRTGISCIACHTEGMKRFKDDVRGVAQTLGSAVDREKLAALYPPQEKLDRLLEQDAATFRRAVEALGSTVSGTARNEPIWALAERFRSDLTTSQAAAEAGLSQPDFLTRLAASNRLQNLGFGQLVPSNGGIKRELWERNYGEVVRELRLGEPVSGRRLALGGTVALAPAGNGRGADLKETLRSARTLFITSKTRFFKPDLLTIEFQKRPAFLASQKLVVRKPEQADLEIEIDRPALTFTYKFTVTQRSSGVVLAAGTLDAGNELEAAPKLAASILDQFVKADPTLASAPAALRPLLDTSRSQRSDILRNAQTVFITSRTQFFEASALTDRFPRLPEFRVFNLLFVKDQSTADLVIEIDRPVLTFTHMYTITHQPSGIVVASGQITGVSDSDVAVRLSSLIVDDLALLK
ncbi:MAG: hypothetical protein K1Y36_06625 [Blastocatellia bacterium]|nr:hypothetical protein [Blastocatellia bacterium]